MPEFSSMITLFGCWCWFALFLRADLVTTGCHAAIQWCPHPPITQYRTSWERKMPAPEKDICHNTGMNKTLNHFFGPGIIFVHSPSNKENTLQKITKIWFTCNNKAIHNMSRAAWQKNLSLHWIIKTHVAGGVGGCQNLIALKGSLWGWWWLCPAYYQALYSCDNISRTFWEVNGEWRWWFYFLTLVLKQKSFPSNMLRRQFYDEISFIWIVSTCWNCQIRRQWIWLATQHLQQHQFSPIFINFRVEW